MRDWQKLKAWAESYRNCPADFKMGAEVVRLVMEDLLALMAENEAMRKDAERYRYLRTKGLVIEGHDFISFGEIADYRVDAAMKGKSDV